MGANFETYPVQVKLSDERGVIDAYERIRKDMQYLNGHGGYTGTCAEDNGRVKLTDQVFSQHDTAEQWLADNAEKWEDTLAVFVSPASGEGYWLLGGWYSC